MMIIYTDNVESYETHALGGGITQQYTDADRTYYEYHGRYDDGTDLVDDCPSADNIVDWRLLR